jgi:ferritin
MTAMAAPAFVSKLNEQLGHEFGAHQQYIAIATYYDALTMPQMAALFYQQATEERDHAMMMVQYLLDADETPVIPALEAPQVDFHDVVEPVEAALAQEKRVTEQINNLTRIARENNDFASDQFMQWFIKEQVEEVAKMSDLLAVVTRSKDNYERIEDWIAREDSGDGTDPTAPPIAGA